MQPLVGEGLALTEEDFDVYLSAVKSFWEEVLGLQR
jgi:hypothetical protein